MIHHTLKTFSEVDVANPAAPTTQTNPLPQPQNASQHSSGIQEKAPAQQSDTHQVDHMSTTNSIDSSHQPAADPSNTHAHSTAHTAHAHSSTHTAHTHDSTASSKIPHTHHFGARLEPIML